MPPELNNDAARTGIIERILLRAGSEIALRTTVVICPMPGCRAMVEVKGLDAWTVGPTAANLAAFQFPMKAGVVDFDRRLVRIRFWPGA